MKQIDDSSVHARARWILVAFLFTFTAARTTVFLIVSERLPNIHLQVQGTHVHHLNYGIFILAIVGGYLLLAQPHEKGIWRACNLYGIGLALTFDEFGMWLHLGGSYWQRASFDAIVVVGAFLGVVAVAPQLSRFRPHHWLTGGALVVAMMIFAVMLVNSFQHAHRMLYRIQTIEEERFPP